MRLFESWSKSSGSEDPLEKKGISLTRGPAMSSAGARRPAARRSPSICSQ